MRIVFMGTPDFAAESLKKLIDEEFPDGHVRVVANLPYYITKARKLKEKILANYK